MGPANDGAGCWQLDRSWPIFSLRSMPHCGGGSRQACSRQVLSDVQASRKEMSSLREGLMSLAQSVGALRLAE